MKSTSPSLFPFVFWVSLLISVLFRQYLWVNSIQSLQNVRQIRVSDTIVSSDQLSLSKNIIILQGVKIKPTENYRYKDKTSIDFLGKTVAAVGNPSLKSPGFGFGNFTVNKAQIDIFGSQASKLTDLKIRFFSAAVTLRSSFIKSLGSLYRGREAEIMAGILLGNKDGFTPEFNSRLQQSGLLHLAAASGYNISIVVGIFGLAVSRITRINIIKVIIVISFILFYIVISGGQASVVRAGLMGMVGFAATLAGSAAATRRLFVAAALGMLLVKPAWVWDLGFQLSAAATAGMIWGVPVFKSLDSKSPDKSYKNYKSYNAIFRILAWPPVAESLAASLATAPVLIFNLGWERLSLTAVPANVLATPLVTPLMAVSAAAGGLGLVSPAMGRLAAVLTRPLVGALLLIIDISAAVNERLMGIFGG